MDKEEAAASVDRKSSDDSVEIEINIDDLIKNQEEGTKSEDSGNLLSSVRREQSNIDLPRMKIDDSRSNTTSTLRNVIPPSTSNNVIQNKIATTTASPAFMKVASRSSITKTAPMSSNISTAAMTSNGKIIYLQRPGGASVPVRVPSSNAIAANPSKSTVKIHVIRTADGNLVPVKGGKSINIPNVSQLAGKKMISTSGSSGQVVIKTPLKTIAAGGSPTTKTTSVMGSTIASSLDASKPKIRQVITSKTVFGNTSNGSPAGGKMVMQNASGQRQVVVSSQNLIKLSPNTSSGQLQAIQIPGKPGLQYVRVLNNTSGIAHKVTTTPQSGTLPKCTVVRQTKEPMKLMVKSPLNDKDRQKLMTTVPTYRKINEVVIKTEDGGDGQNMQTQKIAQINSQIRQFSTSGEARSNVPASKYIVLSKSLIRSTATSQIQNRLMVKKEAVAGPLSPPQVKKLYSVLRPSPDHKEINESTKARAEPVPLKTSASTNLNTGVGRSARSSTPPSSQSTAEPLTDDNVTIRRKHCNCTKSQCLKLYCDCFANGEFCQDCNCKDCLNNLDNEDERQKAIRICLERNPNSFKPKITAATNESDQRLHNKGCNCKRSGCLKNYCECYEAKIPCSSNCKCMGCRNVEDHPDLDMDIKKSNIPTTTHNRVKRTYDDMIKPRSSNLQSSSSSYMANAASATSASTTSMATIGPTAEKQPCNFITQDVVDATIQCLIAQADECKKSSLAPYQTEKMIMEELGRCLVEIIDFSIRNTDQNK